MMLKGMMSQNAENGKYWLGFKFYTIGMNVGTKTPIIEAMKPYIAQLSEQVNESANISVLEADKTHGYQSVMILKEERHNRALKYSVQVGSSTPATASSLGKAMLAFTKELDEDVLFAKPLFPYTANTIVDRDTLFEELAQIKMQGYAMDNEEQEYGLVCIGAPILDRENRIFAAVSVSGSKLSILEGNIEEKIRLVKGTAAAISKLIV